MSVSGRPTLPPAGDGDLRGPRGPARKAVVETLLGPKWSVRSGWGGKVVARPLGVVEDDRGVLLEGVEFSGGRYIAPDGPKPGTRVEFVFASGDHRDVHAGAAAWGHNERDAFETALQRLRDLGAWFGALPAASEREIARLRLLLPTLVARRGAAVVISFGDDEGAKVALAALRKLLKESPR